METLTGFERFDFDGPLLDDARVSHPVYVRGEGPPIIIWQELPGIGPTTLKLVERLVTDGFRIYLPHLFGPLGRQSFAGNIMRLFCMRREYALFARQRSSPIVHWMAALCREVQMRENNRQVGTIGMCLTGGFALTLMADDAVLGGVASQPSLPLFGQSALHMDQAQIKAAREGMAKKGGAIAMRYASDPLCRGAKMEAIEAAFGDAVVTHSFRGRGHALLTDHFSDAAYETTRNYFTERFQ